MAGAATAGSTPTNPTARRSGIAVSPKLIIISIIVIATVWFVIVNRHQVAIYLWVPKVTAPMWLVLLATFAGGLVTGLLSRRGKKKQQAGPR